jgi:tRNA pseudouridine55 synthase
MKTEPSDSSSGILLLDKPVGMTSNAALGHAKRILGIKKAGHTGTLDPLASGLLVLCFGQATKVAGYLLDAEKAYEATIKLGITTDSEDAEGEVIEEREVPELGEDDIDAVLEHFRGPIEQIPPMYSALKYHGRRLYELARRGETVARPPRPVTIHELKLLGHEGDLIELSVRCSKGTYIRSLARDIGKRLECGAHLVGLRRTTSEPFRVADAHTLENLQALESDAARGLLLPADRALEHLPAVHVDEQQAARLQQGQFLSGLPGTEAGNVRIYSPELFVGIGQMDGAGHLRPTRILLTA